jgi:phage tail sheath protein FI
MCAFVATNKAPGVYIEEVQLPGPIAGVGTSTAAFVGPALRGPMRTPVRLSSWTQFVETFGDPDSDTGPFITGPRIYVTQAVQAFFVNGGADCWFVRVGTAEAASETLADRSAGNGRDTLVVSAKTEGVGGNTISVQVQAASLAATTATKEATTLDAAAAADTNQLTVPAEADAARFRAGDWIFLDDGTNTERRRITAISGTTFNLEAPLTNGFAANTPLRIADLQPGLPRFRIDDTTGVEVGSYVSISDGAQTDAAVVDGVERDPLPGSTTGFVELDRGLTNTFSMDAGDPDVDVETQEFTLIVDGTESYPNLSLDPRHSRYFASQVADSPTVDVALADPPSVSRPPENLPRDAGPTNLSGGVDDDPGNVTENAFKAGIDALRPIDEVNVLCIPDRTDQGVQAHMIAHCEDLKDRFAILDPQRNVDQATVIAQRNALGSDRGFAAIYWPWITISDPVAPGRINVPPSGHLAGLYARVDNDRGVFKAPANEALRGVLDVERRVDLNAEGVLNENSVNVIHPMRGRGVVVWGARTIATATQWRYVNIRRFVLFVEESLQEGTEFVVFEPNEPDLWERVKRQVTDFLTRQWSAGALVGNTPEEGFRVRVDEELNPPSSMALGILTIEVILAPAPPAEYVVFRIIQRPGGPVVEE